MKNNEKSELFTWLLPIAIVVIGAYLTYLFIM